MSKITQLNFPSEEFKSTRNGFGEALVEAGKLNPNIWALSADLAESTRTHLFKNAFPKRFVEVGVAEQDLVTVASGMAHEGKIPVVSSYAIFSPGRNWEQIRTTICYNNQPVKIVGSHGGLSVGADGATHQALEDLALMRVLPNMTVLSPCDYYEAYKATMAMFNYPGPVYLRLARPKTQVLTTQEMPFEIGKAEVFREGADVTLIATGPIVYEAMLAAESVAFDEISVEVINLATIKPLDEPTILASVRKTGQAITLEDHQVAGGLGGAVAELLSTKHPTRLLRLGVDDRFGQSGKKDELYLEYGLDSESVIRAIRQLLSTK